jgi:ADP-dependent NAD(P)H-hydrate dehydratase / NAD(P)H-hydrate epimerase
MNKIQENNPNLWLQQLPKTYKRSNKYTRGHAIIVGGYPLTGAARLAAMGAARIGAGLTTIAAPEVAFPIYATALTSIMVRPFKTRADFETLIDDSRISALLIGPGAGVSDETRQLALSILATAKPTVLDADAISVFKNLTPNLKRTIKGICIMTPHDGEFSRLFELSEDRIASAKKAAQQSGAIIVLKGSETIIAAPNARCIVNRNAPATLATAGSGDVLAGMITGLLAQGMEPFLAAAAAVWMHAEAANQFGIGLIAEDLPMLLPKVLKNLAAQITST